MAWSYKLQENIETVKKKKLEVMPSGALLTWAEKCVFKVNGK